MKVTNQSSYGFSRDPTRLETTGVLGKGSITVPTVKQTKAARVWHYLKRQVKHTDNNTYRQIMTGCGKPIYHEPNYTEGDMVLESRADVTFNDPKSIELRNQYLALTDLLNADDSVSIQEEELLMHQNEFLMNNIPFGDRKDFHNRAVQRVPRNFPEKIDEKGFSVDCGTDAMPQHIECQCDLDVANHEVRTIADDIHEIQSRKVYRKTRDVKFLKFHSRLTYYLRTKYFMKTRDRSLINMMSNDARIWMIKEKMKCESEDDFLLMTQSVMTAFLVNSQELKFRQLLKNEDNYDQMEHLNATLAGDLGKVNPFSKFGRDQVKKLVSDPLFSRLKMPTSNINA